MPGTDSESVQPSCLQLSLLGRALDSSPFRLLNLLCHSVLHKRYNNATTHKCVIILSALPLELFALKLPEHIQIDPWDGSIVTGYQLVSSCRHPEHQRLDSLDLAVVAVQSGKACLSNLLQLGLRKSGSWVVAKFVEKPVSPLQPHKLIPNDALESGTNQSISMISLQTATCKKIDIVHAVVNLP